MSIWWKCCDTSTTEFSKTGRAAGSYAPGSTFVEETGRMKVGQEEFGSGTSITQYSGWLWFGYDGVFGQTGLDIPQGSTIDSAHINVSDLGRVGGIAFIDWFGIGPEPFTDGTYTVKSRIRGVLETNRSKPANGEDLDTDTRTTAFVDWDVSVAVSGGQTVFTPDYAENDAYSSPDIGTIIEEIVGQVGWVSGNDMLLILDDMTTDFVDDAGGDSWGTLLEHYNDAIAVGSLEPSIVVTYT